MSYITCIENQITQYLQEIEEIEKLPDEEFTSSYELKDLLNFHIQHFIYNNAILKKKFNDIVYYYRNLNTNDTILKKLNELKILTISLYEMVDKKNLILLYEYDKYEEAIALINRLKADLKQSCVIKKNFNIEEIFKNFVEFFVNQKEYVDMIYDNKLESFSLACNESFFIKELDYYSSAMDEIYSIVEIPRICTLLNQLDYIKKESSINTLKETYDKCIILFNDIKKILITTPKLNYYVQFIIFDQFCRAKNTDKYNSKEDLKLILRTTKRVLKEFNKVILLEKSIKLKILSEQGRIILNKEDIQFQPMHIKLISILANTPRIPIKPEILIKHANTTSKENLKSYISVINKKISAIFPSLEFIKNQSGYGYYLNFEPEEIKIIEDILL